MDQNRIVLTGAMGGGKSTLLRELAQRGLRCVPEPAREILSEQRRIGAEGVPEKNAGLFTALMLSRAVHSHSRADPAGPVIFDRGVPDMLAYAALFGLDLTPYEKAAREYRYHAVFYFPGWKEIYTNDEERKISFEGARAFGIETRRIYETLGYRVIDVPLVPIPERVEFLMASLRLEGRFQLPQR